ncbi:MAG: LPS export ABC transporter periplasmic protein LptC [Betaproteobacteria bacterium]|nr:LPS export ABC transporter periplasmic protein LptC [Betaproteobacteria bacterium]
MKRVPNMLPLLLVLFLAGMTLWLRFAIEAPGPSEPREHHGEPDAVVDNLTLTRLNATGKPHYVLNARRMTHYPEDDTTQLEGLKFAKSGDGPALRITAERGALTHESEEAHFFGNVLLVREGERNRDELRVRTEYLHVIPQRDIVRTDRPITISEGRSVISGVGMEFNRRTRKLTVFANVRGSIEPVRN